MASDRKWKPGSRFTDGRMSDNRIAWLRTMIGQFVILEYEDELASDKREIGPDIRLMLTRPTGRAILYNFTALTAAELEETRKFFNLLFDKAEPVVKLRDKVAEDAYASGDDSYIRIYRDVPQFVVRERPVRKDSKGVRLRSEGDAGGAAGGLDSDGGVRELGEELVDGDQEARLPEDNGQETD